MFDYGRYVHQTYGTWNVISLTFVFVSRTEPRKLVRRTATDGQRVELSELYVRLVWTSAIST